MGEIPGQTTQPCDGFWKSRYLHCDVMGGNLGVQVGEVGRGYCDEKDQAEGLERCESVRQ